MKGILVLLAAMMPTLAHGEYREPAIEACRAYALNELKREGTQADVVIEQDTSLSIERNPRRIGSQAVSRILTGNGAVVFDAAPSAELSFLCLLADEKRPVFFAWQARANAPAMAQCLRSRKLRSEAGTCLDLLLRVAEQDLALVYANRFQEAHERGEPWLTAYRKANDEWREYRDAECARRRDLAPSGIATANYQVACMVELTRRRALDMR